MGKEHLIKQIISEDPRYKNIIRNLWEIIEELGWRGDLKDVVDFMREFKGATRWRLADLQSWEAVHFSSISSSIDVPEEK